jgi:glycosyltransferase involved in cell wall biosynthesis
VHDLNAGGLPLIRSLQMSRALAAVAGEISPDLVHAHWLPESGWMAAREGLGPLVCSAWGSDVFGVRGLARQRSRRALEGARLVMADSGDLARATCELAGRDLPVEIVRWGLDLARFAPGDRETARTSLGLEPEGPLVVSVRGFDPIYNTAVLLGAFSRLRADRSDARLLLKHPASRTPPTVRAAIDRLGLGEAVVVLGGSTEEVMPDVYRAADVIVSIASSDSSPRSVWEALACGRPVVVSDLPWARDELEPDRNALLVPMDAEAVAAGVERVLGDSGLAQRLGAEARALAVAELDPETCTRRVDDLYRSIVRAGG